MMLSEGVAEYISRKQQIGYAFERGASSLHAFSRQIGNVSLRDLSTQDVLKYLDSADIGNATWRLKYYILLNFFLFWSSRGVMPEMIMPPSRSRVRQTFVPYVYTQTDLRSLLSAVDCEHPRVRSLAPQTVRTFLLLLYGTGATVGELIRLKLDDMDVGKGLLTITGRACSTIREIPLGNDVRAVIETYLSWRSTQQFCNNQLFTTLDDHALNSRGVELAFERVRRDAGVLRHDGSKYQPRLCDFRNTFAVHRITSWIQDGSDLNRMLPALAAYLGQAGLGSTDRYLSMTPERFRRELNELSPKQSSGRWRDDGTLIKYLNSF